MFIVVAGYAPLNNRCSPRCEIKEEWRGREVGDTVVVNSVEDGALTFNCSPFVLTFAQTCKWKLILSYCR